MGWSQNQGRSFAAPHSAAPLFGETTKNAQVSEKLFVQGSVAGCKAGHQAHKHLLSPLARQAPAMNMRFIKTGPGAPEGL